MTYQVKIAILLETMSGHSKWSKNKHIKAVADKKRGNIFTKAILRGTGELEESDDINNIKTNAQT